jgi:hypothetical protein
MISILITMFVILGFSNITTNQGMEMPITNTVEFTKRSIARLLKYTLPQLKSMLESVLILIVEKSVP